MRRRLQLAAAGLALALVVGLVAAPAGAQWVSQYIGRTFTSTAPNGVGGFVLRNDNARLYLGSGYLYGQGGSVFSVGGFNGNAGISVSTNQPVVTWGGPLAMRQGATIGTCASGIEGYIYRQTGTGGTSSGARTRFCVCTSDGAASPVYAWQNVVTGTVGNATTCSP